MGTFQVTKSKVVNEEGAGRVHGPYQIETAAFTMRLKLSRAAGHPFPSPPNQPPWLQDLQVQVQVKL